MTAQGVFRDDFYNASAVLTQAQATATTQATSTVYTASAMAGANQVFIEQSGNSGAQAVTTDTAANIIAWLQQAVAAQIKAQIAGLESGLNPPIGVPNLFNLSYTLTIVNSNTSAGVITLSGGTGVTISGTATVAVGASRTYVVTITSSNAVTLTNAMSGTN
jgi:hypothetical protein